MRSIGKDVMKKNYIYIYNKKHHCWEYKLMQPQWKTV